MKLFNNRKTKKNQLNEEMEIIQSSFSSVPEDAIFLYTEIAEVFEDAKAIVTITSDDGVYETGVNLNRIFGERNLKCTVGGVVINVRPFRRKWKRILKEGNIDFVNHSYNHIRMQEGEPIAQNVKAIEKEIVEANKYFEKYFNVKSVVFVCPENRMCENGYKVLEENGFWAVRRGTRGFNSLSPERGREPGQWFNLMCQGILDKEVTTEVRNKWIDTTISEGKWLIEMWHNVVEKDDGGYQSILLPAAIEHIDYLLQKLESNEIWIATLTEAVKYIKEKQNMAVRAYVSDGKMYVESILANDKMKGAELDQLLTVKILIPGERKIMIPEEIKTKEVDGNKYMIVNIVPGKTLTINVTGE